MPCSPHDILALATRIQHSDGCEAASRTVVSRAYYAALHEVEKTFEKRGEQYRVDGESSHVEIITRALVYGKSVAPGRETAAVIAKEMTRLRRERNTADYKIAEAVLPQNAAEILRRAERVLDMCGQIVSKRIKVPPATQI